MTINVAALAVGATGRRVAGVLRNIGRNLVANHKRFSCVPLEAGAGRYMVYDSAFGVLAAGARARVQALLVDAGLVSGAVGVLDALRPAPYIRVAVVFRQTRADSVAASGVWSARRGVARVGFNGWGRRSWLGMATVERVSGVSFQAGTDWQVIDYRALRVEAARAGTRVRALLADTCQPADAV